MLKDVLVKRSNMSDDADKTQERLELEEMLRRKYASEDIQTQGNGQCLNCGDKITKINVGVVKNVLMIGSIIQ
jgi:hypothetical protein